MTRDEIIALIERAAAQYGLDPGMMVRKAQAESSLNPTAGNDKSSARGIYQFTNPTWGQYGRGGAVTDPMANIDAGMRFTLDNIKALRSAGAPITAGTDYLAHFAGAKGAVNVLKADPSAPVASVLGENVVRANPFLGGMTAADMIAWANRKAGEPAPVPGAMSGIGNLGASSAPQMAAGAPPGAPLSLAPQGQTTPQASPLGQASQAMQLANLFGGLGGSSAPAPAPAAPPPTPPPTAAPAMAQILAQMLANPSYKTAASGRRFYDRG